jgi:uncharacterized membrane protein
MIKTVLAFFLAMIISQAVIFNNYFLAIVAVFAAFAIILPLKKKVTEVMNDERDYLIAGKAARLALSLFSVTGALLAFAFMSLRGMETVFGTIGSTLAYSVCALLLFYSAAAAIYGKQD